MKLNTNEFNTQFDSIQKNMIRHTYEHILENKIDTKIIDVKVEGFVTKEPVLFKDRYNFKLKPFNIGQKWGDLFECAWFYLTGKIKEFDTNKRYQLKLDLSGEAAVFDDEGTPIKGFTNGSSAFDFNLGYPGKLYFDINPYVHKDGSFKFWVEAGANDLFGNLSEDGRVMISEIVTRDEMKLKLYYDIESLYSTLISISKDATSYHELYQLLLDVSYNILYENENWLHKSLDMIQNFYVENKNTNFLITAIGHAHMDLAWLWPIRETRRKIGRFISNMHYLIENYDDFVFGISQPQQLAWLKEDYPKLYETFKKHVQSGRIELQGAMWVEPDTNVPGEESLVRQMYYGQNFYREEFGKEVNNLWLPDVFGYNGNMPQIIKKSGLDNFMTIKISWNLINEFPHHSFHWQGIDGSSVLTHMPPEGTYNSPASPRFFVDAKRKYKELQQAPIALSAYGIGNGGGGPGIEHVERIMRQNRIPDIPNVEFGRADNFFDKLNKYADKLPAYHGELYLENHQGTYTSQSNIKQFNRIMEQKLKTFETLLVLTNQYPKYIDQLDTLWKEVLLYQFHDILPGSSIKRVYDEALERYRIIIGKIDKLIQEVTNYNDKTVTRFNPLLENVELIVKDTTKDVYHAYDIKPLGISAPVNSYPVTDSILTNTLETKDFILKINNQTGHFTSIVRKSDGFEYLKTPYGNKLSVYKDLGDGWNIEPHYRKQEPKVMKLINQVIKQYGPVYEVIQNYEFNQSTLKETIVIHTLNNDITFHHDLDWKDIKHMLRTSFPLNNEAELATFDIQFGHLTRSRLEDTSIHKAQFEMSGQQWVNITDEQSSISLLTKGKYGFYVKDGYLDINLLRSTDAPGKNGDIDQTSYSYGLLLNDGSHDLVTTDQKALILNTEFPFIDDNLKLDTFLKFDNPNITHSAIKGSKDKNINYIRLYNRTNTNQTLYIEGLNNEMTLFETNLIEDHPVKVETTLNFSKFEVKTIKIIK